MKAADQRSELVKDARESPLAADSGRVVLLTAGGPLGWCVANALADRFGDFVVIQENPEEKFAILRRRARLLGWPSALSQAACGLALRSRSRHARHRIEEICLQRGLKTSPDPLLDVRRVSSVNDERCLQLLRDLRPTVVAVYGTRILKAKVLNCVDACFVNYHAGINPKYRGQHPAYWALASRDEGNAGITIHLVDSGVDTGEVLYQSRVAFQSSDTILTYQWVQMAAALPQFAQAIADGIAGSLNPRSVDLPSRQHFPPTLGQYLLNGVARGVW